MLEPRFEGWYKLIHCLCDFSVPVLTQRQIVLLFCPLFPHHPPPLPTSSSPLFVLFYPSRFEHHPWFSCFQDFSRAYFRSSKDFSSLKASEIGIFVCFNVSTCRCRRATCFEVQSFSRCNVSFSSSLHLSPRCESKPSALEKAISSSEHQTRSTFTLPHVVSSRLFLLKAINWTGACWRDCKCFPLWHAGSSLTTHLKANGCMVHHRWFWKSCFSEHSWRSHESQKVFLKNVHDMTSFSPQAEVKSVPVTALEDAKLQRSDFGDFILADAWTANLFLSNFLPQISNSCLKEGRLGCSGASS